MYPTGHYSIYTRGTTLLYKHAVGISSQRIGVIEADARSVFFLASHRQMSGKAIIDRLGYHADSKIHLKRARLNAQYYMHNTKCTCGSLSFVSLWR